MAAEPPVASGDDQSIDGQFTTLVVHRQLETFRQERAQHFVNLRRTAKIRAEKPRPRPLLSAYKTAWRLGLDVEPIGVDPIWAAGHL